MQKSNNVLFRQEFALVAPAFVDCLRAISFNAPAVICHHPYIPSTLIALFHGHEVLMKSLPLFVTHNPEIVR